MSRGSKMTFRITPEASDALVELRRVFKQNMRHLDVHEVPEVRDSDIINACIMTVHMLEVGAPPEPVVRLVAENDKFRVSREPVELSGNEAAAAFPVILGANGKPAGGEV